MFTKVWARGVLVIQGGEWQLDFKMGGGRGKLTPHLPASSFNSNATLVSLVLLLVTVCMAEVLQLPSRCREYRIAGYFQSLSKPSKIYIPLYAGLTPRYGLSNFFFRFRFRSGICYHWHF